MATDNHFRKLHAVHRLRILSLVVSDNSLDARHAIASLHTVLLQPDPICQRKNQVHRFNLVIFVRYAIVANLSTFLDRSYCRYE
jgi:hypothetical protein